MLTHITRSLILRFDHIHVSVKERRALALEQISKLEAGSLKPNPGKRITIEAQNHTCRARVGLCHSRAGSTAYLFWRTLSGRP